MQKHLFLSNESYGLLNDKPISSASPIGDDDELDASFKCCDTMVLYSQKVLFHATCTPLSRCYHKGCKFGQL